MERNEFGYETTIADLQTLQRFMSRRIISLHRRDYVIAFVGVVICAVFLTGVIVLNASAPRSMSGTSLNSYLALNALLLFGAVLALIPMARLRTQAFRMQVTKRGPLVGTTRMTLDDKGLTIERPLMKTTYSWGAFRSAIIEKDAVILVVDSGMGVIVPATAFRSDAERFEFAADASKRMAAAALPG